MPRPCYHCLQEGKQTLTVKPLSIKPEVYEFSNIRVNEDSVVNKEFRLLIECLQPKRASDRRGAAVRKIGNEQMLLRLCACAFLSLTLPAMASTGSMPEQEESSPTLTAIFQMAQKEMPLPVLKVVTWSAIEGKRQIAIEMSTACFAWAKKPVMNVMFNAKDESLDALEQALHTASAVVKDFIEAAKNDIGNGGVPDKHSYAATGKASSCKVGR